MAKIINNIKRKISGETLGVEEYIVDSPKKKEKKTLDSKKKPESETKEPITENKKESSQEEHMQKLIDNIMDTEEETSESSSIYQILNIPVSRIPKDMDSVEDVFDVEFDLIAPTGLDPNQIRKFLNTLEDMLIQLNDAVIKKEEDFLLLLEEFEKLQNKYIMTRQEADMSSIFSQNKAAEDKLRLENANLKAAIANLKKSNSDLEKKLEKIQFTRTDSKDTPKVKLTIPSMESHNRDDSKEKGSNADKIFLDMLNSMEEEEDNEQKE